MKICIPQPHSSANNGASKREGSVVVASPNTDLGGEGEIIHELFHSPDWRAIFLSFCIDDFFQRKQNEFQSVLLPSVLSKDKKNK